MLECLHVKSNHTILFSMNIQIVPYPLNSAKTVHEASIGSSVVHGLLNSAIRNEKKNKGKNSNQNQTIFENDYNLRFRVMLSRNDFPPEIERIASFLGTESPLVGSYHFSLSDRLLEVRCKYYINHFTRIISLSGLFATRDDIHWATKMCDE
jgi:hypothetical protein